MNIILCLALVTLLPMQPELELRPIEQGFEDVSPLAAPQRVQYTDLRKPTGFEKVYEITLPTGETAFVRIDNDLVAIFNRSDYIAGTDEAPYPPGMRFHIGVSDLISNEPTRTYETTPASNRVSNRRSTRVPNAPRGRTEQPEQEQRAEPASEPVTEQAAAPVPGPPAIVSNELYRRLRITQLLQSALELD